MPQIRLQDLIERIRRLNQAQAEVAAEHAAAVHKLIERLAEIADSSARLAIEVERSRESKRMGI